MNVLLIGSYFRPGPGGAETVLRDTETLLRRTGHTTAVFATAEPDTYPNPSLPYYPPRLPDHPAPLSIAACESIYSFRARQRLVELVRKQRPDVAHLHNIFEQLTLSIVDALHDATVPIVYTSHDYRPVCPNYRMLAPDGLCDRCVRTHRYWHAVRLRCHHSSLSASVRVAAESYLSRWLHQYDKIDRFIAPSRFMRDVLSRGGLPAERIDVIQNCVDQTAPIDRVISQPPRFVYFGRFEPEKGLDDLLTAAHRLRSGVRVELYGAGPLEEHLRRRIAAEHLPIDIRGYVPLRDIRPALASAVAAVLPARWHENCPMSILEAAACAVSTISTPLGGIPELIDNGHDGLLVPCDQPAALADAMNTLTDNPALALTLGRHAQQRIHDKHRPDLHANALIATYHHAIQHRHDAHAAS